MSPYSLVRVHRKKIFNNKKKGKHGRAEERKMVSVTFRIRDRFYELCTVFQGGIHVYHLLHSYLYQWPLLLVCLLTALPTIFCHGVRSYRNLHTDTGSHRKEKRFWISTTCNYLKARRL
jgi:hypothetical protein